MQDSHSTSGHLWRSFQRTFCKAQRVRTNIRWVNAIVTTIQRQGQLTEDAPDKRLASTLALVLQISNDPSKISVPAVFHVQVQVLARLEVLAVVVLHDVVVSKMGKDLELGVKLLAFLLRHAMVRDFLAAHDEAIGLPAHFANDTKRSMSCDEIPLAFMPLRC